MVAEPSVQTTASERCLVGDTQWAMGTLVMPSFESMEAMDPTALKEWLLRKVRQPTYINVMTAEERAASEKKEESAQAAQASHRGFVEPAPQVKVAADEEEGPPQVSQSPVRSAEEDAEAAGDDRETQTVAPQTPVAAPKKLDEKDEIDATTLPMRVSLSPTGDEPPYIPSYPRIRELATSSS